MGKRFFNVTNVCLGEIQCADKTSIPKFERKNWGRVERKVNGGRDNVNRIFFSGADDDDDDCEKFSVN